MSDAMTDDEKPMTTPDTAESLRQALAERLGWKRSEVYDFCLYGMVRRGEHLGCPDRVPAYEKGSCIRRPDGLPSLPALVSEAEGRLTEEQREKYVYEVAVLLNPSFTVGFATWAALFRLITAPPETRAAALLEIL